MVVDVKFASGSLDRSTGRDETLDPHALGVITPIASPRARPLSSRHLCLRNYKSKIKSRCSATNIIQNSTIIIITHPNDGILSQNFGATMAESTLQVAELKPAQRLTFLRII